MIKDITLGQYFPGESFLHKMDARVKIVLTFLYIAVIFFITNYYGYILLGSFTLALMFFSGIPMKVFLKSLKPMLFFIVFTAVINMFLTNGNILWSWWILKITDKGVEYAILMILRISFLVISSSLLTYTTSPIALTNGLEQLMMPLSKIGVPSHEIAMMMTIALRFIPTLLEETDKIMKAQMARGADFETGNLMKRAKALVPLLVPLFISAFRRADDLAIAMESRCYSGGKGRTSLHKPQIRAVDYYASGAMGLLMISIFLLSSLS